MLLVGQRINHLIDIQPTAFADVVEVVKPVPFARGFRHWIRGFESHRRLQLKAPVEVAPSARAVITTAEAAMTCQYIIGFLAVDLKEIHSDLSQLPSRMPQIWEAPQPPALPVQPMPQGVHGCLRYSLDGMYLPIEKAEMVLRLLLEGNSVSSVERATEVHHTTRPDHSTSIKAILIGWTIFDLDYVAGLEVHSRGLAFRSFKCESTSFQTETAATHGCSRAYDSSRA
jgi:hypothetical protein